MTKKCQHLTQVILKGYCYDAIVCKDCNKIIGWVK